MHYSSLQNRPAYAMRGRRTSGVTLIELLVILGIISISLAIAVPSYKVMAHRNRMATSVNTFILALNLARNEANRMGQVVSVVPVNSANALNEFGAGWCVAAGTPANCTGTVIRTFPAMNAGLAFNTPQGTAAISFDSLGGISGGGTRQVDACVTDPDIGAGVITGRRIHINFIGRAKSHKPDDPDTNKRPVCPPTT